MKFLSFIALFLLFIGCASQSSSTVVSKSQNAETPQIVASNTNTNTNTIPFSVDSVAPSSEVRHVAVKDSAALPTLSALDFAAYYKNPIRDAGKMELPENAKKLTVRISEYPFSMLENFSETEPEFLKNLEPLAWEPFSKYLYAKGAGDSLAIIIRKIESEKWNQQNVFADFQKVEKLYWAKNAENGSWWLKIEPRPWTGISPFWAELKQNPSAKEVQIYQTYTAETLNLEAALDWAKTLAAYLYPTYNTDLEVHTPGKIWNGTPPFSVMRGNPMGTPMWVAFDVPAFRNAVSESAANESVEKEWIRKRDLDSSWRNQALESLEDVCPENAETENFKQKLSAVLDSLPPEQNAWNANGMLWFRRDANSLLAKDFSAQDSLHNPLPRLLELKQFLDSLEIQFLVVPVPTKESIYAERLIAGTSPELCVDVAGRDFIRQLLAAGIDVLDIYPALRSAKAGDDESHYSFQKFDTHWALAAELAALEELAQKIASYAWYAESGATPGVLEMRDTTILREGDLIQQLPTAEQSAFSPETLEVKKIYRDAKPYSGGKNSPILLMGDSFTGVFESVDGKSGGPGSLLAFALGLDVQVMTSWGGGPGVRHRMVKDKKSLQSKCLVIYMMTLRDFWQSPLEWDVF